MLLKLLSKRRFKILWPLNFVQIVLHQSANSLACGLCTHLKRIAFLDLEDVSEGIFPINGLIRFDTFHLEVVLHLFEFWKVRVGHALLCIS